MHQISLQRIAQRRSNASITRQQVQDIVDRALAGSRGKHFKLANELPEVIEPVLADKGEWIYNVTIDFEHIGKGDAEQQFSQVKDAIFKFAPKTGKWFMLGDHMPSGPNLVVVNEVDMIAEVTIEKGEHFKHLFGLEPQIDVLLSALQTARDTKYQKRFHTVLYGLPGCGKSAILQGVKNMVGEEGCIEFDGTQTTAAGAIATLLDAAIIPPLLIIEEIEKVPDAAFMWLLSALDGRAEIRKVNARGVFHRKVPFVCAATVNDIDLFKSRHEGAMASRFSHSLYCPRPGEEVLRRILTREVESINGNPDWVTPAIEYCMKEEKNTDPRRVIAVCLTGRDGLLTGEFQTKLKACREESAAEKLAK